ncbi:hypothetical protein TKK_0016016 [Trichogramma kaykai]
MTSTLEDEEDAKDLSAIPAFPSLMSTGHRKNTGQEPPPTTITLQEYATVAKELHRNQRILLRLAAWTLVASERQ